MMFLKYQTNTRNAKRHYLYRQQQELLAIRNSRDFWKSFGRTGIQSVQRRQIPWAVLTDNNSVSVDHQVVLENWKNCFKRLLNPDNDHLQNNFAIMSGEYPVLTDTTSLNRPITIDEIRFAIATAGKGKALGKGKGNATEIERTDHFNFLGLQLNHNLKWNTHINYVSLKISKVTGLLYKLKSVYPITILKSI